MNAAIEKLAIEAFHDAARSVPAYRTLLRESGLDPTSITDIEDFRRLPLLTKENTFKRFSVNELCRDGTLGKLASVLTSSGHSGVFAFGVTEVDQVCGASHWVDDMLDLIFQVRSKDTLLINCLPMGVKVHTTACTLAETSVRPDMVIALVKSFGAQFAQIIMIGDAAFVKYTLELGEVANVEWTKFCVHVILGEELLAENARKYIGGLLGLSSDRSKDGLVVSSMGVGEIGLNIFSEVPPVGPLVRLRRALHENDVLRKEVFGEVTWVPSLFTYDPRRIFVEFDPVGRLILTTLNQNLRLPLIRYATGDCGQSLLIPEKLRATIEDLGIPWSVVADLPIIAIFGRGRHVLANGRKVFPEAVKEGIYLEPSLARLTTANFRIRAENDKLHVRIQLSPRVQKNSELEGRFLSAISRYVTVPMQVICQEYGEFGSGMTLDYERKFDYFENLKA